MAIESRRTSTRPGEDDSLTLARKVAFLSRPHSYTPAPEMVTVRETHMSWVFMAGDRVCKLKKPVRFPYLDFSTLGRRAAACRAEVALNGRLAPDVYLGVAQLTLTSKGYAIGTSGRVADWLVVMRRLDETQTLEEFLVLARFRLLRSSGWPTICTGFILTLRGLRHIPSAICCHWNKPPFLIDMFCSTKLST